MMIIKFKDIFLLSFKRKLIKFTLRTIIEEEEMKMTFDLFILSVYIFYF
jgi:hypothetical protein